jgi:hypothetical protein
MTKKTRLDQIERHLTPKEWAILLVDEMRKYPNPVAFLKSKANSTRSQAPDMKPFQALAEQAEETHPGKDNEDIRAYNALVRKLQTEFQTFRSLIHDINKTIILETEKNGMKAALELSRLQTIILQDAFGRTASKAALWVEGYQAADADEEENRQIMLTELAAYTDVSFAEKPGDSIQLGQDIRLRLPSPIEQWVGEIFVLAVEAFAKKAAVKIIEDKMFDGHPILYRDTEADLEKAIGTVTDGIATFNEYLKTRAELFKAEWDQEEAEEGIASAIPGEREGHLTIDIEAIKSEGGRQAAAIADQWIKDAKKDAMIEAAQAHGEREMAWNIVQESVKNLEGGAS